MARVYMAMFFLGLIFAVLALISCLSAEDGEVRGLPRLLWVLIILLFPLLGSVAYFFVGRPIKAGVTRPAGGALAPRWRPGGGPPEPPRRVLAPDDDPDFLRSINPNPPRAQNGPPDDKPPPAEATG